ncbi:heme-binding protein 2-like [Spea bombifrons]|uniref:heme-binding protein 2-like n=1 Tax=Spea bombifrons TaxID=233779 RepID=UPI00234967AA|nr:heme-binding protein 2-like [Spea bombifrons]
MQREGCRMGGGAQEPAGAGMITLDDLDNMTDEPGSDSAYNSNGSIEEEPEPMDDAEQDRLLQYWQTVGRGHQVEVPNEMAEPIQQLTRGNRTEERQNVPFLTISRKEKCGEVLYEKRRYGKAKWACVKMSEEQYEQSICLGFMKLMRYICEQNSAGLYLGMTIPILTVVHTDGSQSGLSRSVTVAYYVPTHLQEQPPQATDQDVVIEEWPPTIVLTRSFSGVTNEESIMHQIHLLAELLESPDLCLQDTFIVAGYTNPAAANRQNEIWFIERP